MKKIFTFLFSAVVLASVGTVHADIITYVDATTSNTTLADGTPYTPTAALINDDNQWSNRAFGNGGTVYTANDSNATPGEDAPVLRTRLTGLADGTYNVYAYFWAGGNDAPVGNQRWDIRAGLTASSLTDFFFNTDTANGPLGYNALRLSTADPAVVFSNTVLITDADRRLYQASLGTATVSGGSGIIDIFIDDLPGNVNRTWYDGVGFSVVPEPSSVFVLGLGLVGVVLRRRK